MAQAQTLPTTTAEWEYLDGTVEQNHFVLATGTINEGAVPFTDTNSSNKWITTVFFAVVKRFPDILITIYNILLGTLEEPLRHLVQTRDVTTTSLRSIYYGVIRNFILTTENAKAQRLKKWLEGFKYSLNVSISTLIRCTTEG